MNLSKIGPTLKLLRTEIRLSQNDVERITGINRCNLSSLENSHRIPPLETLVKLSKALQKPVWYIIKIAEQEQQELFK